MEIQAEGNPDVLYSTNEIKLKVNRGEFTQLEELTISKEAISWKTNSSSIFIPWDKIVVQAIQAEPQRSIYLMIDESWENENQDPVLPVQSNGNGSHAAGEGDEQEDEEEEGDDDEQNITEFWLLTDDPGEIDNIYYIITRCGNAENMEEDEDDDDEEFLQGEDMEQMNINEDDERFADAE